MPTAWLPCPGNMNAAPICARFFAVCGQKHRLLPPCQVAATAVTKRKESRTSLGRIESPADERSGDRKRSRARAPRSGIPAAFYADHLDRLLEKLNEMRKSG